MYQFRYFHDQLFVPYASAEWQNIYYNTLYDGAARINPFGGSFGLMFLLNSLEPLAARENYASWQIKRSYLFGEMKDLVAADENVSISGFSFFFGYRCEF